MNKYVIALILIVGFVIADIIAYQSSLLGEELFWAAILAQVLLLAGAALFYSAASRVEEAIEDVQSGEFLST